MKKILIVVDYQKDFVDGSLGFPESVALEDKICAKIRSYKDAGDTVAFTFDTHDENYLNTREGRGIPIPHCIEGTPGWELYGKVAALCDETTPIFKKRAFGSFELAQYLHDGGFTHIELIGVAAHICVFSNAIVAAAAQTEAEIKVDSSCVASASEHQKQVALEVLSNLQIIVS